LTRKPIADAEVNARQQCVYGPSEEI